MIPGAASELFIRTVSAMTAPAATKVSSLVLPANPYRTGLLAYNVGSTAVCLAYGLTCNADTSTTVKIPSDNTWNMPYPIYTGPISAVRPSGNGLIIFTEIL